MASSCYTADGVSRTGLRLAAMDFRKRLGLMDALYFPVVEVLESMHLICPDFEFEIVDDCELPRNTHGTTDVISGLVSIKQSVYEGARRGNGRDRMTIAHELAHFVLMRRYGVSFHRTFEDYEVKPYEDPEWQAKCFAGELLVSKDLVLGMTVSEVVDKCGVSKQAASYQLSKY